MVTEEDKCRRLAPRLLGTLLVLMVCLGFAPALALADVGLYGELSADGTTLTYKYGEYDGPVWTNEATVVKKGDQKHMDNWPAITWYRTAAEAEKVTRIIIDKSASDFRPKALSGLFSDARTSDSSWGGGHYKNVESIEGLRYLNTSDCRDFSSLFYGCDSLTELDLSSFDTSKCTDMYSMLLCENLKKFSVGKKFRFVGNSKTYVASSNHNWRSSADNKIYKGTWLPSNVAATYTAVEAPRRYYGMYRLYNPNSGEHFYTSSSYESSHLEIEGWKLENEQAWWHPNKSMTPVYRMYNPYAGEHHYTTSKNERDTLVRVGWKDEGVGWYSDDLQGREVYRLYNPNAFCNNHHYTTSKNERDTLVGLGWNYEGVAWYGADLPSR